jgi:molecular chaperone DnaK (HSP70)
VGVDFGATHTIVSLAEDGNHPVLRLPFSYRGEVLAAEYTPSAVAWHKGRLYFGPAAEACFLDRYHQGAVLFASLKRLLLDWYEGRTVAVEDVEMDVADLVTAFLTEVRRAIFRALDVKAAPVEAVIAVPANASSSQRFVTLDCFKRAGFRVLRILDEPCASGIQFTRERYKRWDRVEADVIVYDLGGGTFDATYLSIRQDHYDPKVSRGISRLGGDDFDEALLTLVEDARREKFVGRDLVRMRQAARSVKESITPHTRKLHLETPEGLTSVPVNDFYEAVRPLIGQTIDLVESLLAETQGGGAPDRIVVVGGGALLPLAPRMLRERFGRRKVHHGLYPFASVAIGAAIKAGDPEVEVVDRLNNHFGVLRVGDQGEYLDVIFEKGRPLPAPGQVDAVARPAYDPRFNIGRFQYLECDEVDDRRQPGGQTVFWNQVLFPYDARLDSTLGQAPEDIAPTDDLQDERIVEEYALDEHGIITARISRTIQDQFSGCYNLYRR